MDVKVKGLNDLTQDEKEQLQEALTNAFGESNTTDVIIGKVSEGLCDKYRSKVKDDNILDAKIKARLMELEKIAEEQINKEFKKEMASSRKIHEELWNDIFDELKISNRDTLYCINEKTGVVVQQVVKEKVKRPNLTLLQ